MRCCKKVDTQEDDHIAPLAPKVAERLANSIYPPCLRAPCISPGNLDALTSIPTKPTLENMVIDGARGNLVWRGPGSLSGTELRISNCHDSTLVLLDNVSTITVDDCTDCDIVLVASSQSTFLRSSTRCRFAVSSGQLRTRDLTACSIFLHCNTDPIIESSEDLTFMPFCIGIHPPEALSDHSKVEQVVYYINYAIQSAQARASLIGLKNRFERVYNFTPEKNTYKVILQPSANCTDIEKPPVVRFPPNIFDLLKDASVLITYNAPKIRDTGKTIITTSGGMVHGMMKPTSLAQANLFGDEHCYFWVDGIDATLSSREYSIRYSQASLWWSSQLYGLLAMHKLYIRQVAAVLPSPTVERGGIPASHGFIVDVSALNNTLQALVETTQKFKLCNLELPPVKILNGADIFKAQELIALWNNEMALA
ncbi:Hypothetical protein GLP15_1695 [Giardia lamblia P15]|uniref:C-CAP/cofactor C-like domain-containing protein n=1 Tax=Giardia intestinalis (strain P15) TaxID=658858 RepID=E1EW15_GIAIA|nr:Hypothetical protein GLP15_1695 [Giardia lamblia P15]